VPAFHCAPSPFQRKKFGARTIIVVSSAPAVPLTNVFVGCAFAYLAIAIDSSPDSGPIMMSAPSFSMRRLVSEMARSAESLPQPMPTSLTGCVPMCAPVMPLIGLALLTTLAPAYLTNAWIAPPTSAP